MRRALLACVALSAAAGALAQPLRNEVLDDMRTPAAWKASASDQVRAALRPAADGSLCLDYDFAGVSGYAVMRRELPMHWPERFDLTVQLRGSGAGNDFQLKLVDAGGDNVWWVNRPDHTPPAALTEVKLRQRHVEFAWGPTTERALRRTQFVEFVVAAGRSGGKGSLCVARVALAERAPDPQPWPAPRLTSDARTRYADFGHAREFNGLALRWPGAAAGPFDYDVHASDDGRRWHLLRRVRGSDGGLDALFVPEREARHLRVQRRTAGPLPEIALRSAAQWPQLNAVLSELAADAPRGDLPRAFVGEQNYWALVGVDGGGGRSALMSEDGAIEVGRGGFSIEPSVQRDDGRRVTWAGVTAAQDLREGSLPLPRVRWQHADFTLDIEAGADGTRNAPTLLARYVLRNTSARTQAFTLTLAARPWQVNPPQQFLATPGGASPVGTLRWDGAALHVGKRAALRFTAPPQAVTALGLDGGVSLAALQAAPPLGTLRDAQQHASAALRWRVTLAPGAAQTLGWVAPLGDGEGAGALVTPSALDARLGAVAAHWRERLNRVGITVPARAQHVVDTLRTSLAHILMSRDGAALRPGTRAYARSWVRDGAMMVAGLLRLGEADAAREFVDWYAGAIFASGKVPCCVDARGADPVPENDSHGQYLYAVAETWRHTRDAAWLARHWPQVVSVVGYQEQLRQSERTEANRTPARAHLFGLMPPSISHEGYSDRPAYAYWDDFWALRGYKDAVQIAQALGHAPQAAAWARWRDEFERELVASIAATAARNGSGVIAGAADRGDFDPTSTTIALNPAQAQAALPAGLLEATFERYWQEASARAQGQRAWKDYTPYELRSVGALVRLGQAERAHAMLAFFFGHQRPRGWNQWAEVVLPDAREPRFLGDMPHAWVSSDYMRSALELFAYERPQAGLAGRPPGGYEQSNQVTFAHEREDAASLVIGAGFVPAWRDAGAIEVAGLSTPHGRLHYRLVSDAQGWWLDLPQALEAPQPHLRLAWPGGGPLPRAEAEGRTLAWHGRELPLPAPPARVRLLRE